METLIGKSYKQLLNSVKACSSFHNNFFKAWLLYDGLVSDICQVYTQLCWRRCLFGVQIDFQSANQGELPANSLLPVAARRANESHKRLVKIKALINIFFSKTIQLTVVKVYEKCFIALSKYLIDQSKKSHYLVSPIDLLVMRREVTFFPLITPLLYLHIFPIFPSLSAFISLFRPKTASFCNPAYLTSRNLH